MATVEGTLTTAAITATGTVTVTGQADIEYVRIKDNVITTNASNANLEISANGSGNVDIKSAIATVGQTVTGDVDITGSLSCELSVINCIGSKFVTGDDKCNKA